MIQKGEICLFCKKENVKLTNFSICSHGICALCLYERIFSNYIQEFQGQDELKIKCKCENGYLNQSLSQIFNLIKEKEEIYEKEKNISGQSDLIYEGCECANNKDKKKIFSEYFCIDCMIFICKKCRYDIKNVHLNHRILDSKHLVRSLKNNIRNAELKTNSLEEFQEKWDNLSEVFENMIQNNFNNTLKKIDDLIDSAKSLKEFYIKKYKQELGLYLQTFKNIYMFYVNYYKDKNNEKKNIEAKQNNIFRLKYLNNISYEFIDMKMKNSLFFDKEILKLTKYMEKLQNPELKNKLIIGQFIFQKIKKGFKIGEKFEAHQKFIQGLIVTYNDNKIVTASNDYTMKVWDPYSVKIPKQEEKEKIMNLYGLRNGKILASKDNNILIYELNNEKKYELKQSLTNHNKKINALAELDDGTIISGASDKKIILWEEDPNNKQYKVKQIITCEKEIQILLSLNDFKIAYTGNDDGIINILGTDISLNNNNKKITSNTYIDICQLDKLIGKVNCMCKLNLDLFASGGADNLNEKIIDHNIYIWKPSGNKYDLSQVIIEAHEGDINSIILLRDGRIASSSKDRTIKIWESDKTKIDNKIKFVLNQSLNDYKHGLYKLIQLVDDRIVSTTSDNQLIFWNNTDEIF